MVREVAHVSLQMFVLSFWMSGLCFKSECLSFRCNSYLSQPNVWPLHGELSGKTLLGVLSETSFLRLKVICQLKMLYFVISSFPSLTLNFSQHETIHNSVYLNCWSKNFGPNFETWVLPVEIHSNSSIQSRSKATLCQAPCQVPRIQQGIGEGLWPLWACTLATGVMEMFSPKILAHVKICYPPPKIKLTSNKNFLFPELE